MTLNLSQKDILNIKRRLGERCYIINQIKSYPVELNLYLDNPNDEHERYVDHNFPTTQYALVDVNNHIKHIFSTMPELLNYANSLPSLLLPTQKVYTKSMKSIDNQLDSLDYDTIYHSFKQLIDQLKHRDLHLDFQLDNVNNQANVRISDNTNPHDIAVNVNTNIGIIQTVNAKLINRQHTLLNN